MIKLPAGMLLLLLIGCQSHDLKQGHWINPLLGDISFIEKYGYEPDGHVDNVLRIQAHLEYAENRLRQADVSGFSKSLRLKRNHLLDLLHAYWTKGIFPRNYDYPGERRPCFIDRDGRICAVGYLVEQTAGRAVAEAINDKFQYEELMDMNDPSLDSWIYDCGLSRVELAMIQPTYEFNRPKERYIPTLGLQAGRNWTDVSAKDLAFGTNPRLGYSFGLTGEYKLNRKFSIGADLIWIQRGFEVDMAFTDETGAVINDSEFASYLNEYVALPLQCGIQLGSKVYGFGNLGFTPAWNTRAYFVTPTFDSAGELNGMHKEKITEGPASFDLSVNAEIGAGYRFSRRFGVFGAFLYERSLTSFSGDEYFANNDLRNKGVSATLGIRMNMQ